MKKMNWIYVLAIIAVTVGCKKEPIPTLPEGNDPVYTLKGQADGENIDFIVGIGTVTMRQGVSQMNGVLTYYGEIESVIDNEIIRVDVIRPETPRTGGGIKIFQNNQIPFMVHELGKVVFDFGGVGNESNNLQIWDPELGNFIANDKKDIKEFGYVEYKTRFDDFGAEHTFEVKHGFIDNNIQSGYEVEGLQDTIVITPIGDAMFHQWFIDDVLVGEDNVYTGYISDGIHAIKHKATDAEGNEAYSTGLVRFKWGKKFWNMKVNYQPEYTFEPYNYGRVVVSMLKNGEWYSSDYAYSNKEQSLSVDSISFVENNFGNLPTVAFNLAFDAVLMNENLTDSLVLSNVNGRFMVGLD